MKLSNRDFAAKGRSAAQGCGIFFFCGQDEAGASAAANDLVTWLAEPGERVEMSGAELRGDPARLGDEARTNSLFGDQRHIWVRANGDEAHEALKVLVETSEAGGGEACPVIVVATSATDKSRSAKLLEKRKDALVAMALVTPTSRFKHEDLLVVMTLVAAKFAFKALGCAGGDDARRCRLRVLSTRSCWW